MADINDINALGSGFEQFKSAINDRLNEIQKKGSVDPLTEQKITNMAGDLVALQSTVTDLAKKSNRVGASEANADVDAHREAFLKFARKGIEGNLADLEAKAMSVGSDTDGGYSVPETLSTAIIEKVVQINPLRALCDVVTSTSENVKFLYNKKGTTSAWVGETDARTATNTSQLVEITPSFGEVYANPMVTQKLLDDAGFDVEAFIAAEVAQEFARAEAKAFLSGDGVNKPKGMLAGATALTGDATRPYGTIQHVVSGQAAALPTDLAAFYQLKYSLKGEYRSGAGFLANSTTLASLMSKADSQGRPLWQPSLIIGQPSTFLGDPIWECQDMDDVAAGKLPLAYGNYKSAYMIADRIGIRILRDPFTNKPYVGFYTTKRVGGVLKDSEAVKVLKISA
ncbi:phage major capsid protein [Sphingomonas aerophila]|uniref:HK97 family phage major capsid protein n=1 Tax=Sphingomonas aerophila TaxID=1344948 RepID=A0A7W9BEP2_9SPHN|nr:phage major capsid protein [Sphingomonas aerophila]MBB5715854.1 HK97 family phage major capsid protein [Sphingomonas aerophila]